MDGVGGGFLRFQRKAAWVMTSVGSAWFEVFEWRKGRLWERLLDKACLYRLVRL
jgi:hypothetical protein